MFSHIKIICIFLLCHLGMSPSQKPDVYIVLYEDCPVCGYMASPLHDILTDYDADFNFHLVFPNKLSNYKTVQKFKSKHHLPNVDVIIDANQKICKKLGATVTPEAIVVDHKDQIRYRGRINSAYYAVGRKRRSGIESSLSDALSKIKQGATVDYSQSAAVGCYITFEK